MPEIRVFEPALCCNTGVCGPDVDQALVDFSADLSHLKGLGSDSPQSAAPLGVTELGLTEKSGGCCGPTGCC